MICTCSTGQIEFWSDRYRNRHGAWEYDAGIVLADPPVDVPADRPAAGDTAKEPPAGVEADGLTPEEGRRLYDEWCRKLVGISGPQFLDLYDHERTDALGNPDKVIQLVMLMPFGRECRAMAP